MASEIPASALEDPISLPPNPIARFYRGGAMLSRFRGGPGADDDGRPEDWVGSATSTWTPPGAPATDVGISRVSVAGTATTIAALVDAHPASMIGAELLERIGPSPGVLVKLLDAGERLPVHCHPTRPSAARLLGSRFGKTEAWLILGTRDGRPARVWAGFDEPMDRQRLRRLIDEQAVDAILAAMTAHDVGPGEVVFVPGGVPHAIGAGAFLLEVQEPTDFSILAETRGVPVDPDDATLRLGWERAIDFFEPAVTAVRVHPPSVGDLLPRAADPFFRLVRQRIDGGGAARPPFPPAFAVGVVLGGHGSLAGATRAIELGAGMTFCLPAAAATARLDAAEALDLAWCLGPNPEALEGQPLPPVP